MIADGIYFDMPFLAYVSDPALGSGDVRMLRKNPRRYWLGSPLNPDKRLRARYQKSGAALTVGTAMHTIALDGRAAFDKRYVRRSEDPEGTSPGEKAARTKALKSRLMKHQSLLTAKEYDLCTDTSALIGAHPGFSDTLAVGYHEVSVFWTRGDGIRCKARFDIIAEGGFGDLKSLENEYDLPIEQACRLVIKRYRIDIQLEHYFAGRKALPKLADKDAIFSHGSEGPERSSSSTLIKARDHMQFTEACVDAGIGKAILIFIQKSFPGFWACLFAPDNSKLVHARKQIEEAMTIYREHVEYFGPNKPWEDTWKLLDFEWDEKEYGWD